MLYRQFDQAGQIAAVNLTKHKGLTKAHFAVIDHSVDGCVIDQMHVCCRPGLLACETVAAAIRQGQGQLAILYVGKNFQ